MLVRKLRLQRGWSQSQLADMAGVTTRTIQRIERGHKPSLETGRALAAVFEVDLSLFLTEDLPMTPETHTHENIADKPVSLMPDEQSALAYARQMKEFYEFLVIYLVMAVVFLFFFGPHLVVLLVFGALGIGVVIQGLVAWEVIGFLSPNWEKRLAEKKLGRKL